MEKIKQTLERVFKKSFWISEKNKSDIEKEARKWPSESALMRHIITNWFKK